MVVSTMEYNNARGKCKVLETMEDYYLKYRVVSNKMIAEKDPEGVNHDISGIRDCNCQALQ